ncbi:MAG: hypothetical protein ABJC12_04400 [Saprospiraceae bacterium]
MENQKKNSGNKKVSDEGNKNLPAKIKKSDAYQRNVTHDPTTPLQVSSSDAYQRNETHDPSAEGHVQTSDAYERNMDTELDGVRVENDNEQEYQQ